MECNWAKSGFYPNVFGAERFFFDRNPLLRLIALPFTLITAYIGGRALVFYELPSGAMAPFWQASVELPQAFLLEREAFRRL